MTDNVAHVTGEHYTEGISNFEFLKPLMRHKHTCGIVIPVYSYCMCCQIYFLTLGMENHSALLYLG